MSQDLEIIATWDATNYNQIISILMTRNSEIRIRVQKNKLILKDDNGLYLCVPKGSEIRIPRLAEPIIVHDPPIGPEDCLCDHCIDKTPVVERS
jgi:hypothetical protein